MKAPVNMVRSNSSSGISSEWRESTSYQPKSTNGHEWVALLKGWIVVYMMLWRLWHHSLDLFGLCFKNVDSCRIQSSGDVVRSREATRLPRLQGKGLVSEHLRPGHPCHQVSSMKLLMLKATSWAHQYSQTRSELIS